MRFDRRFHLAATPSPGRDRRGPGYVFGRVVDLRGTSGLTEWARNIAATLLEVRRLACWTSSRQRGAAATWRPSQRVAASRPCAELLPTISVSS
jgi:hypothetical protein